MNEQISKSAFTHHYNKDEIVNLEDQKENDLYLIHSGKLLICSDEKTTITPIAILEEGQYVGELSFFDQKPRSAHIISLEKSILVRIPIQSLHKQMPSWLHQIALSITQKIRKSDQLIAKHGIKLKNKKTLEPLSIEDQRKYLKLIKDFRQKSIPTLPEADLKI